jgi:hypothetical protein
MSILSSTFMLTILVSVFIDVLNCLRYHNKRFLLPPTMAASIIEEPGVSWQFEHFEIIEVFVKSTQVASYFIMCHVYKSSICKVLAVQDITVYF